MNRKQRKQEEARIVEQMQDAIDKVKQEQQKPTKNQTYQPMDERTRKKIRLIVGGVCIAVFLVMFFIMR